MTDPKDVFNKYFGKPQTSSQTPPQPSPSNQPQQSSQPTFFAFTQPQQPTPPVEQPKPTQPTQPNELQQTEPQPTQPSSPSLSQPQLTSQPAPFFQSLQTQTPNTQPPAPPQPEPAKQTFQFAQVGKTQEEEFDLRPVSSEEQQGIVKMIYGKKGAGKTVLALSELLEGFRYCCLSFDNQTKIIRDQIYRVGDDRCLVFDAMRYYSEATPELRLETSERTLRYIFSLLNGPIKDFKPDIILIDGTEIMNQICEGTMRYNNNISPFGGVEWTYWKERNMYMNQIHRLSCQIAKVGVTYTAYVNIEEVHTAAGTRRREEPKWAGDIEYKARVVIKVEGDDGKDVRAFFATVENSKIPLIPTQPRKLVGQCFSNGAYQVGGLRVLKVQNPQLQVN